MLPCVIDLKTALLIEDKYLGSDDLGVISLNVSAL